MPAESQREPNNSRAHHTSVVELFQESPLPVGAPDWLPILAESPEVTEVSYAAIDRCFKGESARPWPQFESWLVSTGLANPVPESQPVALVVTPTWLAVLGSALDDLMDDPGFRERLIHWAQEHRPPLMTPLATWARNAGRWDVMRSIWVELSRNESNIAPELLRVFADLPTEARKQYPTLSWGCAMADADSAPSGTGGAAFQDRLILDAATLNADWSLREDTDSAVVAGILRMFGERHLPPSSGPLDAAWRTKVEIETYIDERSRKGLAPGRLAHSFFRVMSARLALFRADLRGAAAEAHWAGILAEDPSVTALALAIEALAHNLAGEVRDSLNLVGSTTPPPDSFRTGSLGQMAAIMSKLALGRECLQLLDRAGVDYTLTSITEEQAAIAGVWGPYVGLRAMSAAVWGDARQGLSQLMLALANQPTGAREQDEPLGGLMLGRARAYLLCRVGAFGAATLCGESVVERFRVVAQTRTLLWAGQLGPAVRAMDLALPDPNLIHADRLQLLIIRGAATRLDGSITPDIETDTVSAFRHLVQGRSYLPIAMLPRQARDAILAMSAPLANDPQTSAQFEELCCRLREVGDGDSKVGLVHLTDREAMLLPLLATSESVPVIARKLHVSVHTVRKQVATLREKFQASTRAELVRKAGSYGALK